MRKLGGICTKAKSVKFTEDIGEESSATDSLSSDLSEITDRNKLRNEARARDLTNVIPNPG
jgi:hypothetical protein